MDWRNQKIITDTPFNYETFKLGSGTQGLSQSQAPISKYVAPTGGTLDFEVTTTAAFNVLSVSVGSTWGEKPDNTYRTEVFLPNAGSNSVSLYPWQFKNVDTGAPVARWSDIGIKRLAIRAGKSANSAIAPWFGDDPTLSDVRWVGGTYPSGTNLAPEFEAKTFAGQTSFFGQQVLFDLNGIATDPEGEALTYTVVSGPSWIFATSNGYIVGTPTANNTGTSRAILQVRDASGGSDFAALELQIGN